MGITQEIIVAEHHTDVEQLANEPWQFCRLPNKVALQVVASIDGIAAGDPELINRLVLEIHECTFFNTKIFEYFDLKGTKHG